MLVRIYQKNQSWKSSGREITLLMLPYWGGVGHQETAVGSGTSQKSVSSSQNTGVGVAGQASATGTNTSAETVVPLGTQSDNVQGDLDKTPQVSDQSNKVRTINIGTLGEEDLMRMLQGYLNSMITFAGKNRNVHKELKETLANAGKVLTQYVKVKNSRFKSKGLICAHTQTETALHNEDRVETDRKSTTVAHKAVRTADTSTDTPCWWPVITQKISSQQRKNKRQRQKSQRNQDEEQREQNNENIGKEQVHGNSSDNEERNSKDWTTIQKKERPKGDSNGKEVKYTHRNSDSKNLVKKRIPKTWAVMIADPSEGETYASIMKRVTTSMNTGEMGVNIGNARRTKSGAILLEVKDQEESEKLENHLNREVGNRARISRPTRSTPVLLLNIPDWLSEEDAREEIRRANVCLNDAEIAFRENAGGGRVAKVILPMEKARQLADLAHIRVGWRKCRIKLIETKLPRCFRCQSRGHIAAVCKEEEAEKKCFRCHLAGHLIRDCMGEPKSGWNTKVLVPDGADGRSTKETQ